MDSLYQDSFYEDYIIRNIPVLVIDVEDGGTIYEMNQYALNVLGSDAVGKLIFDFFIDFTHSLSLEAIFGDPDKEHMIDVSTSSDSPQTFFFRIKKHATGTRLLGRRNLEEESKLYKQIIDINNDLGVLTRKLTKQNVELERLDRLKNQFVAMAAHDLRSPTGNIQSCAMILKDQLGDAMNVECGELIDGIVSESENMLQLINGFLNTATIESGHIEINLKQDSFQSTIDRSIDTCNAEAKKKDIAIELTTHGDLPTIRLDHGKIGEVITNLLMNAIQHSYSGSIVEIDVEIDDNSIKFTVTDHGVGIPDDIKPTLFKAYSGGKTRKTNHEPSTGLGLAISKKIIEEHHGEIGFISKNKVGSAFFFILPFLDKKADEPTDV